MRTCHSSHQIALASVTLGIVCALTQSSLAQKFERATPPNFDGKDFSGIYFPDVGAMLRGKLPSRAQQVGASMATKPAVGQPQEGGGAADGPLAWPKLVSPETLEDLIKGAKLRLDQAVTTPPAFISGGYVVARQEFTLLSLVFGVIEEYPQTVRFKDSAAGARELLTQAAAAAKIGTQPVFNQAKNRLLDLGDVTRGTKLSHEAKSELNWSTMVDRSVLMQLLEWSHEDNLNDLVADKDAFDNNSDAVKRYAELVAVLGKINVAEEMPDADDDDYRELDLAMIQAARNVVNAVEAKDAEATRRAVGQIGQSCVNCHDGYR
ncbi:MAG TPA: hypothetical protein DDW52_29010 [Planctomycetaceae bacterium]|nr:hypothetical protein [Planctomycetaceae bacterium]